MSDPDPPQDEDGGSRKNVAALVIIGLLLVAGWWLMSELQHHREIGNCIASGRRDCVPLVPDSGK